MSKSSSLRKLFQGRYRSLSYLIQMCVNGFTVYFLRIAVGSMNIRILYCATKLTDRLRRLNTKYPTFDLRDVNCTSMVAFTVGKMYVLLHRMVYHDIIVNIFPRHYHSSVSKPTTDYDLKCYKFLLVFRLASKTKMISVSEGTYKDLAKMGTLEDSFDSVISRMIKREKAAASGKTLAGTTQNAATASISTPSSKEQTPIN
jgi:predicted CopG family antitoxin